MRIESAIHGLCPPLCDVSYDDAHDWNYDFYKKRNEKPRREPTRFFTHITAAAGIATTKVEGIGGPIDGLGHSSVLPHIRIFVFLLSFRLLS